MRYRFGDSPADFVVSPGEQVDIAAEQIGYTAVLYPGARLWAYDTETGARVTDLLDASGAEVTEITATSYGRIPAFRGPDGVTVLALGQAEDDFTGDDDPPDLARWILTSTDWPGIVAGIEQRVAVLEDGDGEVLPSAHPLIWTMAGTVEDATSPHRYVNLEGKAQTITRVHAMVAALTGGVTVRVLTVDMSTGVSTVVETLLLTAAGAAVDTVSDVPVSDGTGVTVQVELSDPADEAEDLTVQVMIR